jgi:hypothetical protein
MYHMLLLEILLDAKMPFLYLLCLGNAWIYFLVGLAV